MWYCSDVNMIFKGGFMCRFVGFILLVFSALSVNASDFQSNLKAAEQGDAVAQYSLGVLYSTGEGVIKNDKKAITWYRKAAEQGHAHAQFNLGIGYATAVGVLQDDKKAITWYRKAAEQGHAHAQFNLGIGYATGVGVLQDDKKAYMWFNLSRYNGFDISKGLNFISKAMI
jgi:TPR repeat protein